MNDLIRLGKLNQAYRMIERSSIAHQVLKLGYPIFVDDSEIKTAAVGISHDFRVQFWWNRTFFDNLQVNSTAYVAAHETMHVLLNHMERGKGKNARRWNIACDITVNTLCDYDLPVAAGPDLSWRIRAQKYGFKRADVYQMTTEEIYDALPEELPIDVLLLDNHTKWDRMTKDVVDTIESQLDPNKRGLRWGHSTNGEMAQLRRRVCKTFDWERFTRNRCASVAIPQQDENWARLHRKMYAHYPDIVLPGEYEDEKQTSSILFAIDTSGSMGEDMIAKMVAISDHLPRDKFEVHMTWFDTKVYEAADMTTAIGRGGTDFNCIEAVALGERGICVKQGERIKLTRYPDLIIVMTDGQASKPNLKYPGRWVFIITENGTTRYVNALGATVWKL